MNLKDKLKLKQDVRKYELLIWDKVLNDIDDHVEIFPFVLALINVAKVSLYMELDYYNDEPDLLPRESIRRSS